MSKDVETADGVLRLAIGEGCLPSYRVQGVMRGSIAAYVKRMNADRGGLQGMMYFQTSLFCVTCRDCWGRTSFCNAGTWSTQAGGVIRDLGEHHENDRLNARYCATHFLQAHCTVIS